MKFNSSESFFKRSVLNKISKEFYFHNNVSCGNQIGIPDTFIEGVSKDIWVEFKVIKNSILSKKFINLNNLLSNAQKKWFKRRKLQNDVYLAIGFVYKDKSMVFFTRKLVNEISVDNFIHESVCFNEFINSLLHYLRR
jgi:hypothetical protein